MTADSPTTSLITCSQCGGELHPDEGQIFLTCPYCSATVYLDTSRVVFHWYVAPTLDDAQALAALRRWMSGSQTVKDLDKKAQVVGQSFEYFPIWYFKRGTAEGGGEEIVLRPAAAISVTELAGLKLPAGDLRKYDPAIDAQAAEPSVPLEAALEWSGGSAPGSQPAPGSLGAPGSQPAAGSLPAAGALPAAGSQPAPDTLPEGGGQGGFKEAALVHVPLYFFKYAFRGATYTAIVDAASGTVLASLFPPKAEAPYRTVGAVTALVFLCLAVVPLAFGLGGSGDAGTGLLICGGLGLVAAPLLFAWAFWVASRV